MSQAASKLVFDMIFPEDVMIGIILLLLCLSTLLIFLLPDEQPLSPDE